MAGGNDYNINIVVNTGDAESKIPRVTGQITDLASAIRLAQQAAHLLAEAIKFPITQFEALYDVSERLVRVYDEDVKATERLRTTLRLQGDSAGILTQRLLEQAGALQDVTRYQDDAIVSGQAYAASALGIRAPLERITQAAVDLAAHLDEDLSTAFRKLVQGGQTGSIRGFVQGISDAADESQRLEEVLDFVESNIGGTAQELAKIGAGPLDQLANSFNEFEEALGKTIAHNAEWQAFIQTSKEFFEALVKFIESDPERFGDFFGKVFSASFTLAAASVRVFIEVLDLAGRSIASIFETLDSLDFLPGFESPLTKIREEITRLQEQRDELRKASQQAATGILVDEESGGGVLLTGTDEDAQFPNFLQGINDATRAADRFEQQAADIDAKIADLEGKLTRLSSGALFEPVSQSLAGIGSEISALRADAEAFDPLLGVNGFMERLAENAAEAREETEAVDAALQGVGATATELNGIPGPDLPTPELTPGIRRQRAGVDDTFEQVFGPEQEAANRLTEINELLANNGELVQGDTQKIEELEQAYGEFFLAATEDSLDFETGVDRAFTKFRLEAANSAAVAEKAFGELADFGTDAIYDLVTNGGEGFRELALNSLQEIEKIIIRMLVLQALSAAFPGLGAAAGGGAGIIGAFAGGGEVEAGRAVLVGEKGPEPFIPSVPGTILPAQQERAPLNVTIANVSNPDDLRAALAGGELDDVVINILERKRGRVRNIAQ